MKKFLILFISLLTISTLVYAQDIVEVTGVVTDDQGEPLIGVNISILNAPGLGTTTNVEGKYKIKVEQYSKLIFGYVGFEKQEVLIKDQKVVNVILKESEDSVLQEVVVTATGVQEKVTVTGAITTVDVESLKSNPSGNISNTLAGNVPGVLAMQSSGRPGSSSEFWIRGISTFGANKSALVLVDGFERNLDEINVEDIANFSVLKDASATAIYGSKGANGVILINTKRGESGKIKIHIKVESAYNALTKVPDFVDGYRYAGLMNEARITRNQDPIMQPDEMEILRLGLDPDLYPNVDWQKELLKKGTLSGRASVNLQGGGTTARYFVSGSYYDAGGVFKTDKALNDYNTNTNYRKWNYRVNTDIDITKTTVLEIGVGGSLEKENDAGNDHKAIWESMMYYNPILTPVLYSDGRVPAFDNREEERWVDGEGKVWIVGVGNNPWVKANMVGYRENWKNNIQTNVTLKQDLSMITEGLKFIGRFGYDTYNRSDVRRIKSPEQWKAEKFRNIETGEIEFKRISEEKKMYQYSTGDGNRNEFLEAELHYNKDLGDHSFGSTAKYTQSSKTMTVNLLEDLKNGIAYRNQSVAGRVTYRFKSRYFADFNFGYTGSENFAKGHQFGFFPAVSAAWNIADEEFVKKQWGSWLSLLKVRGSWGKVGNDNLGKEDDRITQIRFPYLSTIGNGTGYNFADHNTKNEYGGLYYSQVASPYVTWEKATKKDIGLDVYLFQNKFSVTVDYFDEKREGIFMKREHLSSMVGIEGGPARANVGSVRTRGMDGNFSFSQKVKNVDLTIRGNMTYSKNETLERDEENNYYGYRMYKGYQVDQAWGFIAEGLYKDWDDIRNSAKQNFEGHSVMPGDIKYKDVNGDGVINDDDKVPIGSTTKPRMIYGFGISANWNGFDFNLHFQGAGKSTFFIDGSTVQMFRSEMWGNVLTDLANSDRWISADISGDPATENPNAAYPRLSYGKNDNNFQESTFWQRDGSYLRLKTLEVGYRLPKQLTNRIKINNMRVFFIGSNLLTWSKFKLWDPEMNNSNGIEYPKARTYTLGLTINI